MRLRKIRYLVGIIATVLFIMAQFGIQPASVFAWANSYQPVQNCTALTVPYKNVFTATNTEVNTPQDFIGQAFISLNANLDFDFYQPSTAQSYITIGAGDLATGAYYTIWEYDEADNIEVGNTGITVPPNSKWAKISDNGLVDAGSAGTWGYVTGATTGLPPINLSSSTEVSCIHHAGNIDYTSNYTGQSYTTYVDQIDYVDNCATLDVGCHVGRVFDSIVDTFIGVGEAIVNGIGVLFLPDTDDLIASFNSIKDNFEQQLGFVAYPFTYIVDMFNALTTTECSVPCVGNYGDFFGGDVVFNYSTVEQNLPTVWVFTQNLIRGVTAWLLIRALIHKFREVTEK